MGDDSSSRGSSTSTGHFSLRTSEPITLPQALEIGIALENLKLSVNEQEDCRIGEEHGDGLLSALTTVQNILVSTNLDTPVRGQVAKFRDTILKNYESTDTLENSDRSKLEQNAITWQHLLREDLGREQRIPVDNTGLLDVNRLIESPEDLLDKSVWNWLDDQPKSDLREACKTLVISCGTSSVILSLRAVEHYLRKWYEREKGEKLDATWEMSWTN